MAFGQERDASLDGFVAFLHLMDASEFDKRVAKVAEGTLQEAFTKTLDAGQTPEGVPWKSKRKNGGRAYPDVASKLTVKSTGAIVRAELRGIEVYGHFGRTGKQVARPMLPDAGAGMPPSVAGALEEAAEKVFADGWKAIK